MKSLNDYTHCQWCGNRIMQYRRNYNYIKTYNRNYAFRVYTDRGIFIVCHNCNYKFITTDHLPERK